MEEKPDFYEFVEEVDPNCDLTEEELQAMYQQLYD